MTVTAPALLMSAMLSAILGLAYGLLAGKAGLRLALYVLIAGFGFGAGYLLSERVQLAPYALGDIPVVNCTVTSVLALSLAYVFRL